jgi:hypothetical protein
MGFLFGSQDISGAGAGPINVPEIYWDPAGFVAPSDATVESLYAYCLTASGNISLGLLDSSLNVLAYTGSIATVSGQWLSAPVNAPCAVSAGEKYYLAVFYGGGSYAVLGSSTPPVTLRREWAYNHTTFPDWNTPVVDEDGGAGFSYAVYADGTTGPVGPPYADYTIDFLPQANHQYVNLVDPLAPAANRITANPTDLAGGDQLDWWVTRGTGNVEVFPDGSFVADATVQKFDAFPWTPADGWGVRNGQTLSVVDEAPVVTTTVLLPMQVGVPFSQQIDATGYPDPTFVLLYGSLPAGLTLSPTGLLSGTPTDKGAYSFTISAVNTAGYDEQYYSGSVASPLAAPVITTTALAAMFKSVPFNQQLVATGNPEPTFAVTAGALPPGITLSPAGLLSGIPTSEVAYNFTVTATNSQGSSPPKAYTGTVQATPLVPQNATLSDAIMVATGGPTINEGLWRFYGGTATTLAEREAAWLRSRTGLPVTCSNNEMWMQFLLASGYTGTLNDMLLQFWRHGGV